LQVSQHFLEISNNTFGTHAIQSLIEIINLQDEEDLLKRSLEGNILKISYNSNGTHIIQKIILCMEEKNRTYLNEFIINNLSKMCMNSNGICVV
jgi:hypothetical protein